MKAIVLTLTLAVSLSATGTRADTLTFTIAPATQGLTLEQASPPPGGGTTMTAADLSAAMEIIRAARKAHGSASQATVFLRGGTYELPGPLMLKPEDSSLTLAAYKNERPILSGGRRIPGWKPVPGKNGWWETEVPAVRQGRWYFRSLFVNGYRAQRARTPNERFFRIDGDSPQEQPACLHFHAGDIKPEWAALGDVEVVAFLAWADIRMFIRAVDETNCLATLSTNPRRSNREKNARYFVENAPDALDSPGEWYLERKTGTLRYIARLGDDLTQAEVVAPQLEQLVVLRGDPASRRPVEHVTLRGLTFCHTDRALPLDGYADRQAAISTHGDIQCEYARHCAIENCTFTHLAGYGIELGRGCQADTISGCDMFDLGAGGIRVGEEAVKSEPLDQNHGHSIIDNHIHEAGVIHSPAVGVCILQSGTNVVAHNEIDHLYYSAISVGWTWGYRETPCRENLIECNHLHDIGQAMLSDMGGIYTLGIQKGTIIRNNLIHDIDSFTYGGWGLYTDEGSTGILLESNIVYHCKSAGFHQHYGRDNVIRNNIFAFNRECQLMRTRAEEHNSFYFTNNIVLFESGELLGQNWKGDRYVMDGNIYWDNRPGAAENIRFSGATLQDWRARGHDMYSLICDPFFVAPRQFDFTLKTNSPAFGLGFRPIVLNQVGPRARTKLQ